MVFYVDQASAHFFGKGGAAAPPLKNQGGAISNQGGAKNFCTFLHLNFSAAAGKIFAKTVLSGLKTIVPVL